MPISSGNQTASGPQSTRPTSAISKLGDSATSAAPMATAMTLIRRMRRCP